MIYTNCAKVFNYLKASGIQRALLRAVPKNNFVINN
jgi:hypothetical protein